MNQNELTSGALVMRLFGSFEVEVGGQPLRELHSKRGLRVLAYLAIKYREPVHRPTLAVDIWPGRDSASDENLNGTLRELRRALGEPPRRPIRICLVEHDRLQFTPSLGDDIDVIVFDQAMSRGQRGEATALQRAVDLYQGPLLHGWGNKEGEGWIHDLREYYRNQYVEAVRKLRALAMKEKRYEDVLGYLRQQVRADDKDEAGWLELMQVFNDRRDFENLSRIRDEFQNYISSPSPAVLALWEHIPKEISSLHQPPDLPLFLTQPIGREKLLHEIKSKISADRPRLIVLTGIGGIGKTRLSILLAHRISGHFRHGIKYIDLAPLTDPAAIITKVCFVLKTPAEQLTEFLKPKDILLIFDNCEHLLDSCIVLIRELLSSCPQLHILATSRHAFNIGEVLWNVPGLEFPSPSEPVTPENVQTYESCRLFLIRAQAISPAFRLTTANAPAVAEICRRLEGIPLALELVAAHMNVIPTAQELLAISKHYLDLEITGGDYARHAKQTLRGVMDWSYDLLSEREKILLCRLSVFAGGWTREAAKAVCFEEAEEASLLGLLKSLKDQSLIVSESQEGASRYRLLETIRQYGADKLSEMENGNEEYRVRRKHRDYFLALAEEAEPQIRRLDQKHWLNRLDMEIDNLQGALEWRTDETGLCLACALSRFWIVRGHLREGRRWLEHGTGTMEDIPTKLMARAWNSLGSIAFAQGDFQESHQWHTQSLALYRQIEDQPGTAEALNCLGGVIAHIGDYPAAKVLIEDSLRQRRQLGDAHGIADSLRNLAMVLNYRYEYDEAKVLLHECLTLMQEVGDVRNVANALHNLGVIALLQCDYDAAHSYFDNSLILWRPLGDKHSLAKSLNGLGEVALSQSDYSLAYSVYAESLSLRRETGDKYGIANSLNGLAEAAMHQGDYAQAHDLYQESLALRQQVGNMQDIPHSIYNLGELALRQGDSESARLHFLESLKLMRQNEDRYGAASSQEGLAAVAASSGRTTDALRLLGAAEALRQVIGSPRPPNVQEEYQCLMTTLHTSLGEAAFEAAWAEGQAMTWDQGVEYALSTLDHGSINTVS